MVIVLTSSAVEWVLVDRVGSGIMVIVLTSSTVDRGFWYNGYRAHVECGRSWVLV